MLRKTISLWLAIVIVFSFAACSRPVQTDSAQGAEYNKTDETIITGVKKHKIGVLVYSITDDEVISFRKYLEEYIAGCFEEIEFVYSQAIQTQEQEMDYINQFADSGVEGILAFNSYDMKAEVELCEQKKMYYMRPAASVSDEQFAEVADNPYFIGVIGPGSEMEYQCGVEMAQFFFEQHYGDEYFIISGGSPMHNEMHLQRTKGILDTLQKNYGVTFDKSFEEIVSSMEPVHLEAGDLKVCICPGFMNSEIFLNPAREAFDLETYHSVLSVVPIYDMEKPVRDSGSRLGVIDNYSDRNLQLFNEGTEVYCVGKYNSIIGPSFAAMYNAVSGHADQFREADGKAFRITQGFWISDSKEDYTEKYALSAGIALNAYNFQDLQNVIAVYNADADLNDLKELAGAYHFEDAVARRDQ